MVLLAGLPVPPGDHTGLGGFVHDVGVLVTALALVAGMLFLVGGLLLLTGRGRSTVLVAVQVVVSLWSWLVAATGLLEEDGPAVAVLVGGVLGGLAVLAAARSRSRSTVAWLTARQPGRRIPQAR